MKLFIVLASEKSRDKLSRQKWKLTIITLFTFKPY